MSLTSVLVFLTFVVVFVNILKKWSRFWRCLENIPQPPTYPMLGNLIDLMRTPEKMFVADRERSLKYYPIYKVTVLDLAAVNLVKPEDIELVLTNMKHITKSKIYDFLHAWLGTGLLTSTDAKWQSRRKLLTPAFHFSILREFINIFNEETKKLVEDLEKDCHKPFIDVIAPITQFTLLSIGETAMGTTLNVSKEDKERYKDAIYAIGELLTYRAPRPWIFNDFIYGITGNGKKEKKIVKTLHTFSKNVIDERKKNFISSSYSTRKRLAMLDLLLKYRSEGADIDDEGIREEVDTFMFEGHDTTSMALCFALMLFANHRTTQDEMFKEINEIIGDETPTYAALQELKYMERCIKESLRLFPSVPFISRLSGDEINTFTGYTIPKDCMVNIQIYDLHHNPNVFPDPEKFDPDRFLPENIQKRHPFAYIPFSAGPRNCIGQKFAMLELKAALCGILKRFILEPVDKPQDIVFISDLVLRPKGSIKVKLAKEYYPVYKEWSFNYGAVNLYHPDDIELILSSSKHIDKSLIYDFLHSWLGTGLLTSGGAKWQTRRKILTPAFHFSILQEFISIFNEETNKVLEVLKSHGNKDCIDVIPVITQFTIMSIAGDLTITQTSMGIKLDASPKKCNDYKNAIYTFGQALTYRMLRPWLYYETIFNLTKVGKLTKKAVETLHIFSRSVIAERKKNFVGQSHKKLAMLDLLLSAKEKGADIDDEGIREEVDTFMFEGHDTTSVAICYVLLTLANHRMVQEEIYQEMKKILRDPTKPPTYTDLKQLAFMERCLKECLRLYPSVPFISRIVTEDVKTATSYVIPEKAMAHIHIYDLHRNPDYYPDPEKFDPDRFLPENTKNRHPFAYLPFSAGPRNCIGQKFAMLELKTFLCGILRTFTLEPIDRPEDVTMITDLVLRCKDGIKVKFVLRK
ncbi:cytochrome P450, family 4, subfamily Q, polypeptide 4 [Asbolus verrucosus]|uniref:Cytochrome P450, family 4, subfamily Q, polypeptide 4 n=1 Tax=Asbolus verrucosus TaxID=1661398 RepID=A0A482VAG7_ASBVE|nr:cytochrome P450, family 4, subfamily Q, polypeptide 4 [Asbolus verrucosus]